MCLTHHTAYEINTSRIAAVSLSSGALAAGIMAFAVTKERHRLTRPPDCPGTIRVIETDGTLDSTFNSGKITNGLVSASALQADGKLIIVGQFSEVHGVSRPSIARLNVDGTLDLSFDPGSVPIWRPVDIALQPDGKIIIAGFFQTVNGVARTGSPGSIATVHSTPGFDPGSVICVRWNRCRRRQA